MALKSMTGFGASSAGGDDLEISVEAKSVNNRFLDVNVKAPNIYSKYESLIQQIAKQSLSRGRIEVSVNRRDMSKADSVLNFNKDQFLNYMEVVKEISSTSSVSKESIEKEIFSIALQRREVLEFSAVEKSEHEQEAVLLEKAVTKAVSALVEMRAEEGKALEAEIKGLLNSLENVASKIKKQSSNAPEQFRERLSKRLEKLGPEYEVDPSRLAQEVAILAERVDITEEVVRVASHVSQFRAIISKAEGGRKLEFLLQEFLREFNTIGSKCQSADIAALVVESKSLIEKIKEQVANIE